MLILKAKLTLIQVLQSYQTIKFKNRENLHNCVKTDHNKEQEMQANHKLVTFAEFM